MIAIILFTNNFVTMTNSKLNNNDLMQDKNIIEFINENEKVESKSLCCRLCAESNNDKADYRNTEKTVIEVLNVPIAKIRIQYYSVQWQNFDEVKAVVNKILQSKPKTLYSYEPWAEGVTITIKSNIEFKNGKVGKLIVGSIGFYGLAKEISDKNLLTTHICFQDDQGHYYWARFATQ